jgi:ribonuclease HI
MLNCDKKNDIVVYCDGFLKYKNLRNGCSVALVVNNKIEFVKRFLLADFSKKFMFAKQHPVTNNVVEYFAMFCALNIAKKYNANIIYSDSEIIVNQLYGDWVINEDHLQKWFDLCNKINCKSMILWIKRNKNVKILGH